MKIVLTLAVVGLLAGCLARPDLSKIGVGMTKPDVIAALGQPRDMSVQGNVEYLRYEGEANYADGRLGGEFYFVRLLHGRVESYGRVGDFDSTKNVAVDYNITKTEHRAESSPADELLTELQRLESMRIQKLITEDEYQTLRARAVERSK